MTAHDPFEHDDAAYVLGALEPPERAAFEAHLATCPACQQRVAEARETVQLLGPRPAAGFADLGVFDDPAPAPDTLLPGLLRKARTQRLRRRGLAAGLAAVAAACAIALAVLLWPSRSPAVPAPQALSAVRPNPVTASAALVSRAWGTEIDLSCKYAERLESYRQYNLVIIDSSHHSHSVGSWRLGPDHAIHFTSGIAVPRSEISLVQITLPDGTPILELRV